jgi:hypothetical protein
MKAFKKTEILELKNTRNNIKMHLKALIVE